ncbi:hypothetical protein M3936_09825 [Sutcliffiella horikoshii]|nr:hypothetical protein [Sutcliffiella horikoshii]MCM3617877.1 hypothetical protein [Sutcliffiella horikoshii]
MNHISEKNLLVWLTFIVTLKLYAVSIVTLDVHNPPRSLALPSAPVI